MIQEQIQVMTKHLDELMSKQFSLFLSEVTGNKEEDFEDKEAFWKAGQEWLEANEYGIISRDEVKEGVSYKIYCLAKIVKEFKFGTKLEYTLTETEMEVNDMDNK